jgi:hypothetical protein
MQTWAEVPHWLRDQAVCDLTVENQVRPTLVAFAGDHPAFLALCRPFDPDDCEQALTELLALVMGFGADRVAVSFGGRARSLDPDGEPDARRGGQQIVLVAVAEACGTQATVDCTAYPITDIPDGDDSSSLQGLRGAWFRCGMRQGLRGAWFRCGTSGRALRAGEPLATGEAEGWLPLLLTVALEQREHLRGAAGEVAQQAARCLALGHELYLPGGAGEP